MFFDSHAHLDRSTTTNNNVDDFFQDDLQGVVHISLNPQEFLANHSRLQHPKVYFATGYYPDHAAIPNFDIDQAMISLEDVLINYPHSALGEIGIDLSNIEEYGSLALQQELFERQILLAGKLGLPVVIHSRMSFNETFESLQKYDTPCIFHCFSYGLSEMYQLLERGDFISLAGLVTYPKLTELHEVAKTIPLEKLLLETDSPYLSPIPFRGKPNIPSRVHYTYHFVAQIRQIPLEELCRIVQHNFYQAFNIKAL